MIRKTINNKNMGEIGTGFNPDMHQESADQERLSTEEVERANKALESAGMEFAIHPDGTVTRIKNREDRLRAAQENQEIGH